MIPSKWYFWILLLPLKLSELPFVYSGEKILGNLASSFHNQIFPSESLLYNENIIDQTFETRRILCECLAEQFFGVYYQPRTWHVTHNSRICSI